MIGGGVGAITEEVGNREPAAAIGGDGGLVSRQRRGHGGRMRRDAGAEIERHAVEMVAVASWTIGAAFLQAIDMRIAKIPAARTLGEVAAERRQMAHLRR